MGRRERGRRERGGRERGRRERREGKEREGREEGIEEEGGREAVLVVCGCVSMQSRTVCPFVEVSFGTESRRTTTACGSNPFWNEELVLPFK